LCTHSSVAAHADDAYKIRLYNPDEQATIAVYQGPSYGHPIKRMRVFRWSSTDTYCIAYNTGDQVAGLVMWPLDGNPAHSMGLVAHPKVISSTAVSCDGKKLLTAGGEG
jgi:cilia- and flagella-associated protein 251